MKSFMMMTALFWFIGCASVSALVIRDSDAPSARGVNVKRGCGSLTCDAAARAEQRRALVSRDGNGTNPQTSLTLDPSVIMPASANTGMSSGATELGQAASLTSTNNFINFCVGKTLTNGQQVKAGSCNPTPMGDIIASDRMPSAKFVSPANLAVVQANKPFTIKLKVHNLSTGNFVNSQASYFSAPQHLDQHGILIAHSHVVIEQISSLNSIDVTDPTRFSYFKALNFAAQNDILSADVTGGLPTGVYRMGSINTAANHQPALVGVAQHGMLDDMVYFTVTNSGPSARSAAAALPEE